MKKILVIFTLIILTLFLVSCERNYYNFPKINQKDEVTLTKQEYLNKIELYEEITEPIDIGLNSNIIMKDKNDRIKYFKTKHNTIVDNLGNSTKYSNVDILTNNINHKGTATIYSETDSDKIYMNVDVVKKEDILNDNNKTQIKGKYYFFDELDFFKTTYNVKFIKELLELDEFIKLIENKYKGIKFYEKKNSLILNFKYNKELDVGNELELSKMFLKYNNPYFSLIDKDNIEFTIVLKNNKLLSFNLNSNEKINDFVINAGKVKENTWSMYLRTNVKLPKYPDFDKYEEKDIGYF